MGLPLEKNTNRSCPVLAQTLWTINPALSEISLLIIFAGQINLNSLTPITKAILFQKNICKMFLFK